MITQDFFPNYEMKPNPACSNALCRQHQAAFQAHWASAEGRAAREAAAAAAAAATSGPVHEDNEWGIDCVGALPLLARACLPGPSLLSPCWPPPLPAVVPPELDVSLAAAGSDEKAGGSSAGAELPSGLEFSLPKASGIDAQMLQQDGVKATDASVEDLMAQLQALNS